MNARPQARERGRPSLRRAVLLVRRARALGPDRLRRRGRLGRRQSSADPFARNSAAAAVDRDRRQRRHADRDARRDARRHADAEGDAAVSAEGVPRDRRPPLLQSLRHRPDRTGAGRGRESEPPRRVARRLDHHPAARQEPVPHPGAHLRAQAAGAGAGALARTQVQQDRDSRALSQPRLFRRRRLWRRRGGATLFRKVRPPGDDRRGGDAGRPGPLAVAAGAQPQSQRRRAARPDRARGDDGAADSSPRRWRSSRWRNRRTP